MAKTFKEGAKTKIDGLVLKTNKYDYLPWPTAVGLADRPSLEVRLWDNNPYISFFGGVCVAVKASGQTTWLPVLNGSVPIPACECTSRDINDSISRCRAKAIAMSHGIGISVFAGYGDKVNDFLRAVGVKPDSSLSEVEPLSSQKGGSNAASYVSWVAAYTAAKITDDDFKFEVLEFEDIDEDGVQSVIPVKRVLGGWMVAVKVTYKGMEQTEWRPILGTQNVMTSKGMKKMDHQPLTKPTTHDWNSAVMRCMTRAVAVVTGYGLSVYAREDVESLLREPPVKAETVQAEKPQAVQAENVPDLSGMEELPNWEEDEPKAVQEPSQEEVSKLLMRIGNIAVIESLSFAKSDIQKKYEGTKALEVLISALISKRNTLLAKQAA